MAGRMLEAANKDALAKQRREIVERYKNGPVKSKADDWENPQYSIYAITDYYGFIHDEGMNQQFLDKEARIKKLDMNRETKWRKLLEKKSSSKGSRSLKFMGGSNLFSDILIRMDDTGFREEITKRIYKGIPQQFKSSIWQVFLDISSVKGSKPKVYQAMLKRALDRSPDIHQIDLDVNRTFRNTTYFRERYNDRQKALLNVLAAYSMYNTEIGYCQGMSEIAGLLLMYLVEEEDVFWGLSQLMTSRWHMHGVFIAGFPRLLIFFNHLNKVIQKLLPKIYKHFERVDLMTSSYALKWFMQCFLDRVPLTLFLRLWDIYILEGEKLLIAMAYNILKMHRKRLLKMDHGSILYFFQTELKKDFFYDDDLVIESLKTCIEELKRYKLLALPSPQDNELPTRPFGADLDYTPSLTAIKERQIVQANPAEAIRKSMKNKKANDSTLSQNSQSFPISEEKKNKTVRLEKTDSKIVRDVSSKLNNVGDGVSQVRYRIHKQPSSINKSKSMYLAEDGRREISVNAQGTVARTKPITLSRGKQDSTVTKSVPDLFNHSSPTTKRSVEAITSNHYNLRKPRVESKSTPAEESLENKFDNNSHFAESNHLPVSKDSSSSIPTSKTFDSLQSSRPYLSRSTNRIPLSSSPETSL